MFSILIIAIALLASLSDPRMEQQETVPEPPPPLDELIPHGEREDGNTILRVLFGNDVTEMTMERYLIGVLAAEMPASFELEALKAQAAAARTNVMYNMRVMPKTRHPDAHVCTDYSCCAAFTRDELLRERWGDDYVRYISGIISAVIETDGVYISYEDEPILAVFHSSSGGKTETSGNVWLTDLPYLLSVDSPETAEQVPNFISVVSVTRADFIEKILSSYPQAVFGADEELWITDVTHTESGRVFDLAIGGVTVRGTSLRSMFGLRSTALEIELVGDDILFTTTGFGHGVGMSQYGANAMAAEGRDYKDILNHYYSQAPIISP